MTERTKITIADIKSGDVASGIHTHVEIDITDLEHDAVKLQGRDVVSTAPSNDDALRWSGTQWIPSGVAAGGGSPLSVEEDGTPEVSNVTVLNFIGATVVDAGGGEAEITISGGGGGSADFSIWMPQAHPPSPSACDDEFDDSTFDTGLWTEFDVDGYQTYDEDDVGFVFTHSTTGDVTGIVQAPTSGDNWTIQTRISCTNYDNGGAGCVGLLLLGTLDPIQYSNVVLFGIYTGVNGNGFEVWTFDDYAKSNPATPYTDQSKYHPAASWLRIEANSGVWRFWTSDDGITWYLRYSDPARDFVPAGVGIGGFFGNTAIAEARAEFFRYQTDLSYGAPVLGDRVDMWRTA